MKIPVDNWTVGIWFKYRGAVTEAHVEVHNGEGPLYGAVDYATTHQNDNFCRKTGRKIALARALKKTWLTPEQRGKVWAGLFEKGMKK